LALFGTYRRNGTFCSIWNGSREYRRIARERRSSEEPEQGRVEALFVIFNPGFFIFQQHGEVLHKIVTCGKSVHGSCKKVDGLHHDFKIYLSPMHLRAVRFVDRTIAYS
jgi:hypothetical protein